jgi:hypothetical protein
VELPEMADPGLESEQVAPALGEQLGPDAVVANHLERQPAEVSQPSLALP